MENLHPEQQEPNDTPPEEKEPDTEAQPTPFSEIPTTQSEQPLEAEAPEVLPDSGAEYPATEIPIAPKQRHIGLSVLLILVILTIIGFAVFCIVQDIRGGVAGQLYPAGDVVRVEIVQQNKPEGDTPLKGEDGKYTIEGIAETVMPSIVEIYTFLEDGSPYSSGSGMILSKEGYIATNAHVVSGAESYTVRLYVNTDQETSCDAMLIGHDSKTDLAVLKITENNLTPVVLGNSDETRLGETVCALGNPAGLSGSISSGIISGVHRKVRAQSTDLEMDCIQTDAAISPGNSGGALVNLYGQVIGITSSKYGSNGLFSGNSYEGLGFAITINEALPILKELMEQGYVGGRVRIGISFLEHDAAVEQLDKALPEGLRAYGIYVAGIDEDSDLKNTALQEGDWILTMNGKPVTTYDSINEAIAGIGAGESIHCRCGRVEENGTLHTFEIDFKLLEDQSGEY